MTDLSASITPVFPNGAMATANEAVRKGSPFAVGSAVPGPNAILKWRTTTLDRESIGEGVWRETATAATFAAWMLIAFAAIGCAWFPAGGIAITMLGIATSLAGLSSRHVKLAIAALSIHAALLCGCYFKSM